MSFRGFYGIADAQFGPIERQVRHLIDTGACAIQLRCKTWKPARLESTAAALFPACERAGIPLILNDVFLPHCSHGTHLGQEDGELPRVGVPEGFLFGRSTHSIPQLVRAIEEGANYAGFGPVYGTQTKANAGPSLGIHQLREAVSLGLPLVAIGGITLARLEEVRGTGTASWTAISAVWTAADPLQALRAFSAPVG
ncbi:MAG: thiamine phosphate synthase [Myxococcota bacterium]|nr:thiamine phosphate synthase [Myxococcota bacterium]